jgi:hypothetical protein
MLASVFVHVTDEPTEILIGFGVNPLLPMDALTVVGVGAAGERSFPQAIAAVDSNTAIASFRKDMMISSLLPTVEYVQTKSLRVPRKPGRSRWKGYGWLTKTTSYDNSA